MIIFFNKYHGAGNDFIIIDNRKRSVEYPEENLVRKLCDRHLGIGADGLILLEEDKKTDFRMRYFNSDGRESTMCGNGGRCIAAFAHANGIAGSEMLFRAADGIHKAIINSDSVSISMNDVNPPQTVEGNIFVDTGSPHYIIFVDDTETVDVKKEGAEIRWSDHFAPDGANVNFVQVLKNGIRVRTFERGVEDETLSCGTGVTASAIACRSKDSIGPQEVNVFTRGGNLTVSFRIPESNKDKIESVWLTGPTRKVFEGNCNTDNL